ncbi:MAG: DNA/RNA non-specific endonuclease [Bacteroidaceae bacterium]|nr:DNA/RNA non-specific endonuclease [Bacteroidaceae bacterium]
MVALTFGATFFTSCGDKDEDDKNGSSQTNVTNKNANLVGADETVARIEMPHLNSQHDYICHKLSNGDVNYTLEYDRSKLHARWVAYTYDTKNAQKNYSTRTNAWDGEPFYDGLMQYQVTVQTFKGYQRGHIVGSAERYYSQEANEQTFYMSNMSPMIGAFNDTYWGEVEDLVRDNWGRGVINQKSDFYGGTLYVVKGGTLDQLNTTITVKNTLGDNVQMAVPKYYWIACLFVSSTGTMKAIGFWVEHKNYNNTSTSFLSTFARNHACSIDELEEKTGLDFFCNVPDNAEELVEANYNISQWSGL